MCKRENMGDEKNLKVMSAGGIGKVFEEMCFVSAKTNAHKCARR